MAGNLNQSAEPVLTVDDLVRWFAAGEKRKPDWRVGTEHEKVLFRKADLAAIPYDTDTGVNALLKGLEALGGTPILEKDTRIGLTLDSGATISLEPGGQFELSGAPLEHIHATAEETRRHIEAVRAVGDALGIGFLSLGMAPTFTRADVARMPKGRYAIMTAYMPKVGGMGLDMMYRTATVQANLDYSSEADMVKKMRVALALQPVVTALFANSPFSDGRPNGYLSMRSHIWEDTDPARTGMLGFVFDDGFGYERYADYLLDVPMYFVKRDGVYHDVAGASFRDFMAGKLAAFPGERPRLSDWEDQTSVAFPEVRLKRYLEMRGADMGPEAHVNALPALWVGLLYEDSCLENALDLVRGWSVADMAQLRADVPKQALDAVIGGRLVRDVAADMLAVAREGLKRRARLNSGGDDETVYLHPLEELLERGRTLAEDKLEAFYGRWHGSLTPLFTECAF
ncbi:MAG: glutamate--cysteine ligase [Methylobacteriaceae bacterium]|jgi:glutamate--cysteine ligase|nr:glutamate--cysteine ligase [Methylobacteriaceae bacterium]